MQICHILQSKLNELKEESVNALSELADSVRDVETFDDFKKMQEMAEQKMKEEVKIFEGKRKELEGLKLNFEEELLSYLGVTKEYVKTESDNDGYIISIRRPNIRPYLVVPYLKLKEVHPDLRSLIRLKLFDLSFCDVINPLLPNESIERILLDDCYQLARDYDMSNFLRLRQASLDRSAISDPPLPRATIEWISFKGCMNFTINYDLREYVNLKYANFRGSSTKRLLISPQQDKSIGQDKLEVKIYTQFSQDIVVKKDL